MAVSELDLQLEFYINGVAILIIASLGILGNILSLLLFTFRYFAVFRIFNLVCVTMTTSTKMSQQNLKFKTVPLQKRDQHSTIATAISKQYHCD